jgi:hypothetical protein
VLQSSSFEINLCSLDDADATEVDTRLVDEIGTLFSFFSMYIANMMYIVFTSAMGKMACWRRHSIYSFPMLMGRREVLG